MKCYERHGFKEFVVALGYKGEAIKDYFVHYRSRAHGLTVCLRSGDIEFHGQGACEDWKVHLLDTGATSQTGYRIKRSAQYIGDEPFMVTYGDGVSDVDVTKLVAFHKSHGKLATLCAVRPPARFGGVRFDGDAVMHFEEKPQIGEGWINGGFFVLQPGVQDYIDDGNGSIFERDTLERLAAEGQLMGYRHEGFWQCMDTVRDVQLLEKLWQSGQAPWAYDYSPNCDEVTG
jgi:glucose-1-phosphate cytidylyltransferase